MFVTRANSFVARMIILPDFLDFSLCFPIFDGNMAKMTTEFYPVFAYMPETLMVTYMSEFLDGIFSLRISLYHCSIFIIWRRENFECKLRVLT